MLLVKEPRQINETFAAAVNRRSLEDLLSLYEPDALAQGEPAGPVRTGIAEIREMLTGLLAVPGTMRAVNHFCLVHGDLALLRADWAITSASGEVLASASSAEIARRQPDGRWLYVIDHAVGASLPRVV